MSYKLKLKPIKSKGNSKQGGGGGKIETPKRRLICYIIDAEEIEVVYTER